MSSPFVTAAYIPGNGYYWELGAIILIVIAVWVFRGFRRKQWMAPMQ